MEEVMPDSHFPDKLCDHDIVSGTLKSRQKGTVRSGTDTIEFHILPQTINGEGTQTIKTAWSSKTIQKKQNKKKTKTKKKQDNSTFPADGYQIFLNKMNTISNRKRTDNDN